MSRRWLLTVSILAHVCLGAGVLVSGFWRLERLEPGRTRVTLTQPLAQPQPEAGGRPPAKPAELPPKRPPKVVAKGMHQPMPQRPPEPVVTVAKADGPGVGDGPGPSSLSDQPCVHDCVEVPPPEPVCGNGAVEPGEQCDDGNLAAGDGCSATCQIEVRPQRVTVAPSVLQALRTSGDTQVHPDEVTQHEMVHDGARRVEAVIKLCVTTGGSVGELRLLRSTGYSAYDAVLLAAVSGWRYQPYRLNDAAIPACSTVRFVYTLQ